jgi:hydrogenase/urease accessory protein HupE
MLRPRRPVCQNTGVNRPWRPRFTDTTPRGSQVRAPGAAAALAVLTVFALVLLPALQAKAHEVRPALVQILETGSGGAEVTWKQPVAGDVAVRLSPRLSGGALDRPPDQETVTDAYRIRIWRLPSADGLSGQTLSVDGLSMTVTDVLVRVQAGGAEVSTVLKPSAPSLRLDLDGPAGAAVPAYLRMGVEHILTGPDHLAFVLGLLLLVGLNLGVVKAVTAFTVAHSLTLAGTALGLVRVDPAVVEVLVALSIVFVAVELASAPGARPSLTRRKPWLVALAFGLLHGFAFAGALAEIGLPKAAAPQALLLFNVGVEIGQLAFLAVAALVILALRRLRPRLPFQTDALARVGPAYAIGGLSAFWLIERLAAVF